MKLEQKAADYARTHLQGVRIVWVDRPEDTCDSLKAVRLCADRGVSGRIVAAVAQDKRLEDMLNRLLDDE